MIKLTGCARRLPHLTHDEFDAYWRDQHGPLVRSLASALRIRRYVQTSTLMDGPLHEQIRASRNSMQASFDGCAEIWFDSLEEMAAVRESEVGIQALQALLEDERRFVDLKCSQFWYGIERVVLGS